MKGFAVYYNLLDWPLIVTFIEFHIFFSNEAVALSVFVPMDNIKTSHIRSILYICIDPKSTTQRHTILHYIFEISPTPPPPQP